MSGTLTIEEYVDGSRDILFDPGCNGFVSVIKSLNRQKEGIKIQQKLMLINPQANVKKIREMVYCWRIWCWIVVSSRQLLVPTIKTYTNHQTSAPSHTRRWNRDTYQGFFSLEFSFLQFDGFQRRIKSSHNG